ncbi:DUF58 domain-containing protein [Halorubrum sp. BOL3-1]|uniref:DUF58 domain-containing protein n=1 Tax=Halorubrum sp. BOL3-1 TaxID=2497325 RepID=UPI001004D75A|nr:DUF58 domain-containing protein [Halorubrum sp. BOL3-1]QAU14081.1 DUF58 domain-containing protein [Halorubrum sp. BOL3-1]
MRHTRYRIMRAYAILLVAAGVATTSLSLVLAAAVPLIFTLYGALSGSPTVEGVIEIDREISPETPLPGQPVEVTLTVRNTGETAIPDLRLVDSVPKELGVTEGSPHAGSAIAAGGKLSMTYTLAADRGTYTFDDVAVTARNLNGTRVVQAKIKATGVTDFECRVAVEDIPVQQTTAYTGQLATDSGGPGVEFYATREYRPEDPVKRIDWRQYAKTGKLATIDYREQHAAHVVVLTDSRPSTHVAASSNDPTGATLSAYAATIALEVLIDDGHHVSLGALGIADPETDIGPPAWVSADVGTGFTAHATAVCNAAASATTDRNDDSHSNDSHNVGPTSTNPHSEAASPPVADGGVNWQRLQSLVPTGAQVMLCTPVTDEAIVDLVESLRGSDHEVTVVSPQTAPETVGGRTVALQRAVRLDRLRFLGATVIDWEQTEKLPVALARALNSGVR